MNDKELLAGFTDGTLAEFPHADHVRVAWLYLQGAPLLEAIANFTADLKQFATAKGSPQLYHETITWAYLLLIHERMQRTHGQAWPEQTWPKQTWEDFAAANPDLLARENSILRRYYQPATLQSDLARRVFLFPDNPAKKEVTKEATKEHAAGGQPPRTDE